jgi:hypothetical protein
MTASYTNPRDVTSKEPATARDSHRERTCCRGANYPARRTPAQAPKAERADKPCTKILFVHWVPQGRFRGAAGSSGRIVIAPRGILGACPGATLFVFMTQTIEELAYPASLRAVDQHSSSRHGSDFSPYAFRFRFSAAVILERSVWPEGTDLARVYLADRGHG